MTFQLLEKKRLPKSLIYLIIAAIFSSLFYGYSFYFYKKLLPTSKVLIAITLALLVKYLFEEYIKKKIFENPTYCLFAGVFFSLFSFATSYFLFKSFIGLSTILFTVILAMPLITALTRKESGSIKSRKDVFFKRHKPFINFYIYFFIGIFLVFFVIAIINQSMVFSLEDLNPARAPIKEVVEQKAPTKTQQTKKINLARFQLPARKPSKVKLANSIFKNNFYVMFIAWILSLFYGAGALFLITFNSSIFASALVNVIKMKIPSLAGLSAASSLLFTYSFMACNMGIMFIHMIPEVLAYFVAAMSGGLLATAFVNDQFMSKSFKKTIRESFILLIISGIIVYGSAFLEVYVSKQLYMAEMCKTSLNPVNYGLIIVVILILIFEFFRQRRKKKRLKKEWAIQRVPVDSEKPIKPKEIKQQKPAKIPFYKKMFKRKKQKDIYKGHQTVKRHYPPKTKS